MLTARSYQAVPQIAQEDELRRPRSLGPQGTMSRSSSANRWAIARAESNILTEPTATPDPEDKLGVRETAGVAIWWGIVWFIGNWLNNTALGLTSVASMTIIATTSGTCHPLRIDAIAEVLLIKRLLYPRAG